MVDTVDMVEAPPSRLLRAKRSCGCCLFSRQARVARAREACVRAREWFTWAADGVACTWRRKAVRRGESGSGTWESGGKEKGEEQKKRKMFCWLKMQREKKKLSLCL